MNSRTVPFSRRVALAALTFLYVCVMPGIAILVPRALALAEPSTQFDWLLAQDLPPVRGPAEASSPLRLDGPAPLACKKGTCVSRTTRPWLEATVDPDPTHGYRFLVFDLSGRGGMTEVAAEAQVETQTWAPEPGLLRDGHVYMWTVIGDDETDPQPMGAFVVDLRADGRQPAHDSGPVSVGLISGELHVGVEPSEGLSVEYRTTDPTGRAAGETPRSALSDGWRLGGTILGEAPWVRVEVFGPDVAVLHAMDGTAVRYTRGEGGTFAPPSVEGVDVSFTYPALVEVAGGLFVAAETDGGLSNFDAMGQLASFERAGIDGTLDQALDVTWFNGRIMQAADSVTGRSAIFSYLGERNCPRVPDGFDGGGGATNPLCQVLYLDGVTPTFRTTNFFYVGGNLARVVGGGGATVDFAYDGGGRLARVRETTASDVVASGRRADDDTVLWRVSYDASGRVAEVLSPDPTAGAAPLRYRYDYGAGTTAVVQVAPGHADIPASTITFDPASWDPLTDQAPGRAATYYVYDEDGDLVGSIDPAGLQTSWRTDDRNNIVAQWGPAPAAWFDANGEPQAAHASKVATVLTGYNEDANTQGMLAIFFDSMAANARAVGVRLLNGQSQKFPQTTAAGGARMVANGGVVVPDEIDTEWRLVAPGASSSSTLAVGHVLCELGSVCEVDASREPQGTRVTNLWVHYVADGALPPNAPPSFSIETRRDGGSWTPIDLSEIRAIDIKTSETRFDVYREGEAPVSATRRFYYDDALLGTVGRIELNGALEIEAAHETANPELGQFGRIKSTSLPSGLTARVEYYGPKEVATSPVTGQAYGQRAEVKSTQVGSLAVASRVFDDLGSPLGLWLDDRLVSSSEHDDRGRLVYFETEQGDDPILSPARSVELAYGASGDPLETRSTWTIGERTFVETTTVDLLGRAEKHVDLSGVESEVTYDARGVGHTTTRKVLVGQSWQLVSRMVVEVDDSFLTRAVEVLDVTGRVHRADVTEYDAAGRRTHVNYSNGTELDVVFDPVTGHLSEYNWRDQDGNEWNDRIVRSSQTGRVLNHMLSGPDGTAARDYEYDSATGFLTRATLDGSGDMPTATWDYEYGYDSTGSSFCSGLSVSAALDGARTRRTMVTPTGTSVYDYCYDENDAPARVRETTTPNGGSPAVRNVPLDLEAGAIVKFETASLQYDIEGNLAEARDGDAVVHYVRDAAANIIEEIIDHDGMSVVRRARAGGLVLDGDDQIVAQMVSLPGGVSIRVDPTELRWVYPSQNGDRWWVATEDGRHDGQVPSLFSPDGEPLTDAVAADPTDPDTGTGWRALGNGRSLGLATPLILFGARVYVPALAAFTTSDPIPNGALTPYAYADHDPINLADADGQSSTGTTIENILTNPWFELALVTVLTIVMVAAAAVGAWPVVMAAALLLFGYNTYLSVYWFMNGDYFLGAHYAFHAGLSLAFFAGAVRMQFVKTNIAVRTQMYSQSKQSMYASKPMFKTKIQSNLPYYNGNNLSQVKTPTVNHLLNAVKQQKQTVALYKINDGRTALGISRQSLRSFPARGWVDGVRILMHAATGKVHYLSTTFFTILGLRAMGHAHAYVLHYDAVLQTGGLPTR